MTIADIPTSSPNYQPEANRIDPVVSSDAADSPDPTSPIGLLGPGTALHAAVLGKLLQRLKSSEDKMSSFHSRWQANERRFMAYINRTDFDKMLKDTNDKGEAPSVTTINVPYIYATVWTIVTYLVHTFCGQKPLFQVSSYSKEAVEPARKMETILQFNADKSKTVRKIFQWMMDGQIYGLGVVRNLWITEWRNKTVQVQGSPLGAAAPDFAQNTVMDQKQPYLCYEGNDVTSINPYQFFPDPRVPIEEVNRRGEFVFWRNYEGIHTLKRAESAGTLAWIDAIGRPGGGSRGDNSADASVRDLLTGGDSNPGAANTNAGNQLSQFHQLDQGTIDINPLEWGLGESSEIERWIFTIANKKQIIQAEPFKDEHGKHPISVIEPNSIGYGFGQLSIVDMLGPIQDVLSWFVNSHMFNVRSALNNMFVVDPNYIEMQDLKNPGPGKFIRLKAAAMGRDVRTVIQQLAVQDVTSGHIENISAFMRLGDILSGVNDTLRGVPQQGGRRSATESRMTGESGASRQAALARMVSAQGMTDLAEMQASNVQQYQSMEFYLRIVGEEGILTPIHPDDVQGNFYFPIHDGALPLDRVALLDVWKEVWMAVSTNAQLSQQYNGPAIFEYMANLAGAKNISQFRLQVAAPGAEMPTDGVGVNAGLPGLNNGGGQPGGETGPGAAPQAASYQ